MGRGALVRHFFFGHTSIVWRTEPGPSGFCSRWHVGTRLTQSRAHDFDSLLDATFYDMNLHRERFYLVGERCRRLTEPLLYGECGAYGRFWRAIWIAIHYELPMERADTRFLADTAVTSHYRHDRRGVCLQAPGSVTLAEYGVSLHARHGQWGLPVRRPLGRRHLPALCSGRSKL